MASHVLEISNQTYCEIAFCSMLFLSSLSAWPYTLALTKSTVRRNSLRGGCLCQNSYRTGHMCSQALYSPCLCSIIQQARQWSAIKRLNKVVHTWQIFAEIDTTIARSVCEAGVLIALRKCCNSNMAHAPAAGSTNGVCLTYSKSIRLHDQRHTECYHHVEDDIASTHSVDNAELACHALHCKAVCCVCGKKELAKLATDK
jgi:hypothetical protein